ncbi:hypothetical protein E9228_002197 [Curtobacterium flaccumfaciens]|uniref:Uncharacterized protein n=1 Tax=Curtobacterium salicis TaxID=1779862 RepID=A0ABX0T7V3_9MICO|nr:hypothetical protein [Curtobacterium sp. WW7]NII41550.1 hypothetical protein [Curtobacterium sp. WW7]
MRGTFSPAINAVHREYALSGSRSAGRYSRLHEPTLYLSSLVDGVIAAMIAHEAARSAAQEIIEPDVEVFGIVDLHDAAASDTGRHRPR